MPDLEALNETYQQAWHGSGHPTLMMIHCPHCNCGHYVSLKSNYICEKLMKEIEDARVLTEKT